MSLHFHLLTGKCFRAVSRPTPTVLTARNLTTKSTSSLKLNGADLKFRKSKLPTCSLPTQVKGRKMSTSSSSGQNSATIKTVPLGQQTGIASSSSSDLEDPLAQGFKVKENVPGVTEKVHPPSVKHDKGFDQEAFLSSWQWLTDFGPGFPIHGDSVKIIQSPDKFYTCLLEKTKSAKRRISLASLYLGSGPQEQKLVAALEQNGTENQNLKIKVLLDFTRGSRGTETSSRTMLLPLIKKCHSCEVYLYHTPQLRGLKKRWLPQRWNEIIGLQHMKIYIFDDSVLISGANLSTDYFTNRQDRYFLFKDCKDLADFYDGLIDCVSHFSFHLDAKNNTALKPDWKTHPSDGNLETFISHAKDRVLSYYNGYKKDNVNRLKTYRSKMMEGHTLSYNTNDTWIFPLIQMGGIGISFDKDATCRIFEKSPVGSHIKLATGYFNLTSEYINKIIQNPAVSYDILMAHPKANGFFGASGFAGGIPAAYTLLAKQFLDNADASNQLYRLAMREYIRSGWTYHAKGLWYYPPNSTLPAASLVGSPNFGHRSVYRDLETQIYLITLNRQLQEELEDEQRQLFSLSKTFVTTELSQPDRAVPLWVRMVVIFFRNFF